MDNIKILLERLGFLQITNGTLSETNKQIDKEMSIEIALATTNNNIQAVTPKSIVPDPG